MVSVQSGLVTATISGNVTSVPSLAVPSATQTIVNGRIAGGKTGTSCIAGTGLLMYTVTGGKTFYCTSISITGYTAACNFEIRDGTTVAGTLKFGSGVAPASNTTTIVFPSPMAFTTGVFVDAASTTTIAGQCNGFEQ